jgi:hypothetical protein
MKWVIIISLFLITACTNSSGWKTAEKEALINSCVKGAVATAESKGEVADKEQKKKFSNYCTCYQQQLEQQFPQVKDMAKATAPQLAKAMEVCIGELSK